MLLLYDRTPLKLLQTAAYSALFHASVVSYTPSGITQPFVCQNQNKIKTRKFYWPDSDAVIGEVLRLERAKVNKKNRERWKKTGGAGTRTSNRPRLKQVP